jgi:hypothetical protein
MLSQIARSTGLAMLVFSSLVVLPACSADAGVGEDFGSDENDLTSKIAAGTYVLRYGPSGSLSEPYVAQRHVTRLTVSARNAFEADVLVETAQTQVNPLFPWLTYKSIEKKGLVRRGTMKFGTDREGNETVDFGDDVGVFRFAAKDGNLTLTATLYQNERRTELKLDPSYQPPAGPAIVSLDCIGRHDTAATSRGTIQVTLDRDSNQAGKAKVARAAGAVGRSEWPTAGTYDLAIDETLSGNGWREFSAKGTNKHMTIRFPVKELEKGTGSFDAAGSYPVGDGMFGGDFHLSLRCTHKS